MGQSRPVLGIDFGTTNSYFSKYLTHPSGQKIRLIDFGNDQLGGLPSTILYRKGKSPVVGKAAEIEWGEATPAERRSYTLRTHFKPDITRSEAARQDATAFLRTIREQLEGRRVDFISPNHEVIMGVPGEADEVFKDALQQICQAAGYGAVKLVPEPIGALLYHLWNKDLAPAETQKGVLVVDFGGGTCDFAYMQQLRICHAWGDMLLGGRLFDDLFFQWFLEQNPGALEKLLAQGDEYYVHWLECRQVKELFSVAMAQNRAETIRARLGKAQRYGTLSHLTWGEFTGRARQYRPHPTFTEYLRERNLLGGRLLSGEPIDLFGWFREALGEGLARHHIRSGDVERVILTGGSSLWPFVMDIVCEELHLEVGQVLTSENPKAAISEGLVVLPWLQVQYERVSEKLQQEKPRFFKERIEPEITRRLSAILNQILNDVAIRLYDGEIAPIIYQYREQGGALSVLKDKIRAVTLNFVPQIEERIREKLSELNAGLPEVLHRLILAWFEENGITYFGERVSAREIQRRYRTASDAATSAHISELQREIIDLTGVLVITITAAVAGTITGGAHTALIATGPAGWIIGAIATAMAGWVALEFGRDKVNELVEQIELPAWMVRMILRDGKVQEILREGREKLKAQLEIEIGQAIEEPLSEMKKQMLANIDREIESLTLINHL